MVDNSVLLKGKSTRPGLYKCRDCRKPFSATLGTIYERSHIPLHKWLLATHLWCRARRGISSHQLFRMPGFGSYRTAWFMAHRIREAIPSRQRCRPGAACRAGHHRSPPHLPTTSPAGGLNRSPLASARAISAGALGLRRHRLLRLRGGKHPLDYLIAPPGDFVLREGIIGRHVCFNTTPSIAQSTHAKNSDSGMGTSANDLELRTRCSIAGST